MVSVVNISGGYKNNVVLLCEVFENLFNFILKF